MIEYKYSFMILSRFWNDDNFWHLVNKLKRNGPMLKFPVRTIAFIDHEDAFDFEFMFNHAIVR